MAGFRIEGNTSGNVLEVDALNRAKVVLPSGVADAGAIVPYAENDDGTNNITGEIYRKSFKVSEAHRLKVGIDQVLFGDTFQDNFISGNRYIAQVGATALPITQVGATSAAASGGGYICLNGLAGAVTTTAGVAVVSTRNTFSLYGNFELIAEFDIAWNQSTMSSNCEVDWGFGQTTNTNVTPTDGVFFRMTSAGLYGVVSYNTTNSGIVEYTIGPLINNFATPTNWAFTPDKKHRFEIVLDEEHAEYWVDGSLRGEIDYGSLKPTQAMIWSSAAQPLFIKQFHTGTTSTALTTKLASINVLLVDVAAGRTWNSFLSSVGQHSSQLQNNAQTINGVANAITYTAVINGTDTSLATVASPKAFTPTANAATGGNGLGGLYQVTWPTASTSIDYIISSYLVPAPAVAATSRKLVLYGIRFDQCIQAVTAATGHVAWTLAYGGTSLTQTTTEVVNNATPAKAYRRLPLGISSCRSGNGAVGDVFAPIDIKFAAPITVYPGEYILLTGKFLVVPTGMVTYMSVMFDGLWE